MNYLRVSEILEYDEFHCIESDPWATAGFIDCDATVASVFLNVPECLTEHEMTPREARVLAASLLRAANVADHMNSLKGSVR